MLVARTCRSSVYWCTMMHVFTKVLAYISLNKKINTKHHMVDVGNKNKLVYMLGALLMIGVLHELEGQDQGALAGSSLGCNDLIPPSLVARF